MNETSDKQIETKLPTEEDRRPRRVCSEGALSSCLQSIYIAISRCLYYIVDDILCSLLPRINFFIVWIITVITAIGLVDPWTRFLASAGCTGWWVTLSPTAAEAVKNDEYLVWVDWALILGTVGSSAGYVVYRGIVRGQRRVMEWFKKSPFSALDPTIGAGSYKLNGDDKYRIKVASLWLADFLCCKMPYKLLFREPTKQVEICDDLFSKSQEEYRASTIFDSYMQRTRSFNINNETYAPKVLFYYLLQTLLADNDTVKWVVVAWKGSIAEMDELSKFLDLLREPKAQTFSSLTDIDAKFLQNYFYWLRCVYPHLDKDNLVLIYIPRYPNELNNGDFATACKKLVESFQKASIHLKISNVFIASNENMLAAMNTYKDKQKSNGLSLNYNSSKLADVHFLLTRSGEHYMTASEDPSALGMFNPCTIYHEKSLVWKGYKSATNFVEDSLELKGKLDKIEI